MSRAVRPSSCTSSTWAIVLAGGDGRRLEPLARQVYGYDRPKQFCAFGPGGTLLERTIDRALRAVPEERVVIATSRKHRREARECLGAFPTAALVEQPANRDTLPGILLPVMWVLARDPTATVLLLPSDHHVTNDAVFVDTLRRAAALVEREPGAIALLGAYTREPEDGYGWILPGAQREAGARAVASFCEKPPRQLAEALLHRGALLNTFVMAAKARTLSDIVRERCPGWWARLRAGQHDPESLEEAYAVSGPSNFSTEVLEPCADRLRVVSLPEVGWSDVGTPERALRAFGHPAFRAPAPALVAS